jgi:hypothetical protein
MQQDAYLLPINIGLTNHYFKLVLGRFLEKAQQFRPFSPLVHTADISTIPVSHDIRVVLFVERALSLGTASALRSELLLNNTLLQLDTRQIAPTITAVDIVDCGAPENGPLSAIAVLHRWLEMISECLPGNVEVNVHAIDVVERAAGLRAVNLLNTASSEFRAKLANFIDNEIAGLSGRLEARGQCALIAPKNIEFEESLFTLESQSHSGFEKLR